MVEKEEKSKATVEKAGAKVSSVVLLVVAHGDFDLVFRQWSWKIWQERLRTSRLYLSLLYIFVSA